MGVTSLLRASSANEGMGSGCFTGRRDTAGLADAGVPLNGLMGGLITFINRTWRAECARPSNGLRPLAKSAASKAKCKASTQPRTRPRSSQGCMSRFRAISGIGPFKVNGLVSPPHYVCRRTVEFDLFRGFVESNRRTSFQGIAT